LLVLINLIIHDIFGWCVVIEISGESCTFTYTNILVRVKNLSIMLIIPILISSTYVISSFEILTKFSCSTNGNASQSLSSVNYTFMHLLFQLAWSLVTIDTVNELIVFVDL
jgi:hypothetical protein